MPPGETTKTIDVLIIGDTTVESNETIPGATDLGHRGDDRHFTGDRHDRERRHSAALPALAIAGASKTEGNSGTQNLVFTVTLSQTSTSAVTVRYASANGTATAGSDYNAASGTLTFAPGVTSRTVTVAVRGDTTVESRNLPRRSEQRQRRDDRHGHRHRHDHRRRSAADTNARCAHGSRRLGRGFVADMTLTNTGTATTSGWQLEFELDANITNIWNAEIVSHVGSRYVIRMASWNGKIPPGGKVTFGLQASGSDRTAENVKLTLL